MLTHIRVSVQLIFIMNQNTNDYNYSWVNEFVDADVTTVAIIAAFKLLSKIQESFDKKVIKVLQEFAFLNNCKHISWCSQRI